MVTVDENGVASSRPLEASESPPTTVGKTTIRYKIDKSTGKTVQMEVKSG
jgi:hypothetical protein